MLADRIAHLYWMGGSTDGGNVTEFAEFNAWADPDAVDVVLRSNIEVTMFGLNVTHQVLMDTPEIEVLRNAGTPGAQLLADFLEFYRDNGTRHPNGQPMHDPCAVLGFTHHELFDVEKSHIVANTSTGENRGRTTVQEPTSENAHHVAVTVDAPRVIELILAAAIDPSPES